MTVADLLTKITKEVLNPLIILFFAVASMMFAWGIIQYVLGSQGSDQRVEQGKKAMFWGIIGMFIMASAWGFVKILCDFFGTCDKIPGLS